MKMKCLLTVFGLFIMGYLSAQTSYYGMTNKGGASDNGTIFKTNDTGGNLQTVFSFDLDHPGKDPKSVFTQASNGKIYGTTQFGGTNLCSFPWYQYQRKSGVMFEYDPSTDAYNVLFNFNDTITGCWPQSAPVLASNGKLYGVTPSIGGFSQHYGTVYSYDLSTGVYTKIHSFGGSNDGKNPVGNLLIASDGKLYGITSRGGFQDKGVIFKIDPATDTYTKLLDMWVSWYAPKSGQGARAGLIQASNGMMYGTTEQGGNYPPSYQYAFGNIFSYNPTTNVATNLYGFNEDSLGQNPDGAPVLVGSNNLYCITHQYYQIPGTYNVLPHYYLWKYNISSGTAMVVDSIANGEFDSYMSVNSNGKIILTGHDYNISYATRFWEFDPATNTRTLIDTNANLRYLYKGLMLASNGKYYAGGAYPSASMPQYTDGDGSFVEYDAINHTVTEKFRFSEPIDGINPEGDLFMATNGKFYGMTTKGGTFDKGVIFEFNPANDTYTKKFDLDSLSGYEPKGSLMEASNGKLYGMTSRGGLNGYGAIFEIDTSNWTFTKKADFNSSIRKVKGRLVEAWDGNLYGLSTTNYGTIFQYNISTAALVSKHTFSNSDGYGPEGSLALADNGKLYGITKDGGSSYYSRGTLFEYDPATSTFTMKKQLYNYTGYHAQGNTPLMGSDGKMYLLLANGGNGNTEYDGGAIDEYIPGATSVTNKVSFQVNNTGSKPMGDLMESANGKFYGYAWIGGANNKGTIFEYNPATATLTKKVDFDGTNGANPMYGSLSESNTSAIVINQQPNISSSCVGDTAYLTISATHGTLLHYQWYKGGNRIAGATNDTLVFNGLAASDAGTYSCKITGGAKAVVSNNLILNPVNKPSVSIDNLANAYCLNDLNVNMTATPSGGVFSGSVVNGSVFSPAGSGAGTFDIIYSYTDAQGCSNADTVTVTVNTLPDASFTGYTSSYCDNDAIDTLIPTVSGGSFSGPGITGNSFDPSYFASSGALTGFPKFKYTITDANNCTNVDSVTVSIHHAPIVTLSGLGSTYCSNDELDTLVASPSGGTITAGSFLTGNVFNPANANTNSLNTIYYTYTNSNNCTNSDTLEITVNAAPDASFTGLAATYCIDADADTLVPNQSGGTFGGDITSGNIFNPQSVNIPGGALSAVVHISYAISDNNGCSNADTMTSVVYPLPTVSFGSIASTFCDNDNSISLSNGTPSGGTYLGNGISGNTFDPQQAGLGADTLVYTFTNSNNCTNSDTAITNIYPAPVFSLGNDTNICINNVLTLSTGLGAGYTFLWSDGSTNATLTIDASSLGTGTYTYSVVVKNTQSNCEETDVIDVIINACTGIEETDAEANNVRVYPNPSKGLFSIKTDVTINGIEVYSADGRLVEKQNWEKQNPIMKLDLRDKTPGVYYLLLNNGKTIIRKQLIIK